MTRITDLTEKTTLTGAEFAEISSLSTSVTITATTISALASDNSYNDSGSGFVAAGFAIGDRVNVTGFTGDVANNIFAATVTAVTAGKLTIGGTDGDVIVDDAAGESVTITKWESKRASASNIVGSYRGCLVGYSANVTSFDCSGGTTMPNYTTQVYDTDSIHSLSTNPSRLTVPSGVTRAIVFGGTLMTDVGASGVAYSNLRKNASDSFVGNPYMVNSIVFNQVRISFSSGVLSVASGDYFEFRIGQSTGDTTATVLADRSYFGMQILE